jgi:hypothetical protein
VYTHGNENEEHDNAGNCIGNGMERGYQGRTCPARYNCPVQACRKYPVSMEAAEDLVDQDVVRSSPADKSEVRETLEDPPWKPIPHKGAAHYDQEVLVSANSPTVGPFGVRLRMVVKRIEKRRVHQIRRPDHRSRPYQESSCQSGQAITRAERRDAEQKLESPSKVLTVVYSLGQ